MSKSKVIDPGRGKISYHHRPMKLSIEVNSAKSSSLNSDDNSKFSVEDLLTQKHIENENTTFRNNNKNEHRFDIDFKTFNESNANFVLQSSKIKSTTQFEEKYTIANQNHINILDSFIQEFGQFNFTKGSEKECYQKLIESNSKLKHEFKLLKNEYEISLDSYGLLKEKAKLNLGITYNDDLKGLIDMKKKLESRKNTLNADIKATSSQIMKNREIVMSLTNKSPSPIKRRSRGSTKTAKILTTNLEIESIEKEIMQEKINALIYECELKDKQIKILRDKFYLNSKRSLEEESILETEQNVFNFEEEFNITYNSNLNTDNNDVSKDNLIINIVKPSNMDMRQDTSKNKKDNNMFDVSLKRFEECKSEQERINQIRKNKENTINVTAKKENPLMKLKTINTKSIKK